MALQRRAIPPGGNTPKPPPWDDSSFFEDYPAITSFIRDEKYADGSLRRPGALSWFVMDGALKIAVNDKDRNVVAFVTAQSVTEILTLVEEGIANDSLEWKAGSKMPTGKVPPY